VDCVFQTRRIFFLVLSSFLFVLSFQSTSASPLGICSCELREKVIALSQIVKRRYPQFHCVPTYPPHNNNNHHCCGWKAFSNENVKTRRTVTGIPGRMEEMAREVPPKTGRKDPNPIVTPIVGRNVLNAVI
jgi:hypothetical protein